MVAAIRVGADWTAVAIQVAFDWTAVAIQVAFDWTAVAIQAVNPSATPCRESPTFLGFNPAFDSGSVGREMQFRQALGDSAVSVPPQFG